MGGGVSASMHAGIYPPRTRQRPPPPLTRQTPPREQTHPPPPDQADTPQTRQTPQGGGGTRQTPHPQTRQISFPPRSRPTTPRPCWSRLFLAHFTTLFRWLQKVPPQTRQTPHPPDHVGVCWHVFWQIHKFQIHKLVSRHDPVQCTVFLTEKNFKYYPPGSRPKAPPLDQADPPGPGRHPPNQGQTPPGSRRSRLQHTVNERPVRILLECILVIMYLSTMDCLCQVGSYTGSRLKRVKRCRRKYLLKVGAHCNLIL